MLRLQMIKLQLHFFVSVNYYINLLFDLLVQEVSVQVAIYLFIQ